MASGVRRKLDSDLALAVTCVAGHEQQDDVPVGQMYLALATPQGVDVRGVRVPGDRDQVRTFATTFSLSMLRTYLQDAP